MPSTEDLDNEVERALDFGLVTFGMGVASVDPDVFIDLAVTSTLKGRYRAGMKEFILKIGMDEARMRKYLTLRGRQIGTKAARLLAEFGNSTPKKGKRSATPGPVITSDIAEEAALAVEAEVKGRLKPKYEAIYAKRLDVICPR